VWVTVRLYSPWKTTKTSGQDVSEFLDILGLVKSFKFFWRKKIKKIEIFFCGAPDAPEDQAICLFPGLLANPDMALSLLALSRSDDNRPIMTTREKNA
jgi:hypothetical protein